jgi:Flp pilus assembly protein TadG
VLTTGFEVRWSAFVRGEDGVSAVEFSLIAPILLAMFMASVELPRAYMIGKRLNNAATAMADLISQGTYTDLAPVFAAATTISNPYDVTSARIVLTAGGTYQDGSSLATQACSSAQLNGQARAVGSSLGPPPAGMATKGDRFVVSEVTMNYKPVFPLTSSLVSWSFSYKKIWPVRDGKVYNGQAEIILPGGKPCPP